MDVQLVVSDQSTKETKEDEILQQLVLNNDIKAALLRCEKRWKKNKSLSNEVNRAILLIISGSNDKKTLGISELSRLLQAGLLGDKPEYLATVDYFVHIDYPVEGLSSHLRAAWEQAATKHRKDASFLEQWYDLSLVRLDWDHLRKVTLLLSARAPQDRSASLLKIFALYAQIHKAADCDPPPNVSLLQMLCARMLQDVVKETLEAYSTTPGLALKNLYSPLKDSRLLQTASDWLFIFRIFEDLKNYGQILDALRSPSFLSFKNAHGDVFYRLEARTLSLAGDTQSLAKYCSQIISDLAHMASNKDSSEANSFTDDHTYWRYLHQFAGHLETKDLKEVVETAELIAKSGSYNAALFLPVLQSRFAKVTGASETQLDLSFITKYYTHPALLEDIPQWDALGREERRAVLDHVTAEAKQKPTGTQKEAQDWLTAEILSLTLDYRLLINEANDAETLESYATQCIRLIATAQKIESQMVFADTDRRPADNCAVLAASALIHLYELGHKDSLIQAVLILEARSQNSKYNYDLGLLLILLHLQYGNFEAAKRHHANLSIKNIQALDVSWILSTRLPSLRLPQRYTQTWNALRSSLRDTSTWYANESEKISKRMTDLLKETNFLGATDYLKLSDRISGSIPRFLTGFMPARSFKQDGSVPILNDFESVQAMKSEAVPLFDTRAYTGFPDNEALSQTLLAQRLQLGPPPNRGWCQFENVQYHLHNILNLTEDSETWKYRYPERFDNSLKHEDLTVFELCASEWHALLNKVIEINSSPSVNKDEAKASIEVLLKAMSRTFLESDYVTIFKRDILESGKVFPTWVMIHSINLLMTTHRLAVATLHSLIIAHVKRKASKAETDILRNAASEHTSRLSETIGNVNIVFEETRSALREVYDKGDVADSIVGEKSGPLGSAIADLCGKDLVKRTLDQLVAGWIELLRPIEPIST